MYHQHYKPTRKSCHPAKTALSSGIFFALVLNASTSYAGAFGNALSFDGLNAFSDTGDYVSLPLLSSNPTTPPFTIEAWIKPNGNQTQWASIITSRSFGGDGTIGLSMDGLTVCPFWDNFYPCTTSSLTTGVWQHVAIVFLATSTQLFVNGTSVTLTYTGSLTGNNPTSGSFNIGYDYDNGSNGSRTYNGLMDEVRIWSVDKSADIVNQSYRCSPLSGTPTGLLRYYKFDETTGTTASDSSGNGGNGTLTDGNNGTGNGPAWTASTIDTDPTSPCYVPPPPPPPPPVAPTNLTATATSPTQINLSWTDNSSDETGFKIESPAGTLINTTTMNVISYSHTGLTCGTTYNYTVKATNTNGDSTGITATKTLMCPQTITFGTLSNKTYGDAPFSVTATASSSLAVSFAAANNCTVSGATVTITGAGSCTVTASQGGNANYDAAVNVLQTFSISKIPQTLTFTPTLPTSATVGDAPLTLTATGGASGNPVTFASTTPSVCTVSGTTLTIVSAGTCTVTADQAGNANYNAASQVSQNMTVNAPPVVVTPAPVTPPPPVTPPSAPPLLPMTLKLSLAGTGTGRITSDLGGLDCSSTSSSCSYTVNTPTWVTLMPLPNEGSELSRWTGDPACTATGQVLITQDTSCTAEFTLKSYQLTANFLGKGRVTGPGIDCPGQCTATYRYGTTVTLKAQATRKMWDFSGWRGCDSQGNLKITNDVLCQAVFTPDPNIPNAGDGNGDGLQDVDQDNVVSLPDKISGTYLTFEVQPATCIISDIYPDLPDTQKVKVDPNKKFPQGLLYFDIACPQAQVSVYYHAMSKLYRNLKFYKFGPKIPGDLTTIGWYQLPNIKYELVMIGGKPVVKGTYTLTDGQLGDSTGVDGHIVDPGGVALPK